MAMMLNRKTSIGVSLHLMFLYAAATRHTAILYLFPLGHRFLGTYAIRPGVNVHLIRGSRLGPLRLDLVRQADDLAQLLDRIRVAYLADCQKFRHLCRRSSSKLNVSDAAIAYLAIQQ